MLTVITILWVVVWALILVDLFRRDWSTPVRLAWALIMLILPVLGVLVYLVVRPPSKADVHGVIGPDEPPPVERAESHHPV